jgi:hypothetical protein
MEKHLIGLHTLLYLRIKALSLKDENNFIRIVMSCNKPNRLVYYFLGVIFLFFETIVNDKRKQSLRACYNVVTAS